MIFMKTIRYTVLIILGFASCYSAHAQLQSTGNTRDSIAQSKVVALLEKKYVLKYYDENINTPGDFIYSSHIETLIKKRPGADFNDYWIQVKDHRRYEGDGISFNFFVDPKTWKVSYFDAETNLVWSWEQWAGQSKYAKS
jgi:hypothetical protein